MSAALTERKVNPRPGGFISNPCLTDYTSARLVPGES